MNQTRDLAVPDAFTLFSPAAEMTPTRPVYRCGNALGKSVLVLHEVYGANDQLFKFAARLSEAGFTTYVPILFGGIGRHATWSNALLDIVKHPCLLHDFAVLAKNQSSPIVSWLRVLGRLIYEESARSEGGSKGLGVVGLCLTGNFALTMMLDKWVVAPVVSEPALPPPYSRSARESMHLSQAEIGAIKRRVSEGAEILAFRFHGDGLSPAARYANMEREFAPGFHGCGRLNPPAVGAHSVLTGCYKGPEAQSVEWAFAQLVAFLHQKLD